VTMQENTKTSFPKNRIRVLLLENIHKNAVELFEKETYQIDFHTGSLDTETLKEKIKNVHILGIRSTTKLTSEVLSCAKRLICIGCFCIGTNQVDLEAAEKLGIPVFNSPFCNTRSVAEMIIAQIINLSRHLGDTNMDMHKGVWKKISKGRNEIRGKSIGIVGYGHIGSQVSVLSESFGMQVYFYDIIPKLALGNAKPLDTLDELLAVSDFVTVHVPETDETKNMISSVQLKKMKKGSYLLNASRGTVVVLEDLRDAILSGHIAGAYIDVFPTEPNTNNEENFITPLTGLPNVMLTPHVGGSTEEAQASIGIDVAIKLIKHINEGSTSTAVNFPLISAPVSQTTHRLLNTHQNVPGVLLKINSILVEYNITRVLLGTTTHIGYTIIDVDKSCSHEIKKRVQELDTSIRTRILY